MPGTAADDIAVEALHEIQIPHHHTHLERPGHDHLTHPHGTLSDDFDTFY
jgi:hypothetical protein